MPETFYEVLGIPEDASAEEITAAYRERVKETHPDHSEAPDADERFRRVRRAKEVLGDETERRRYDELGHGRYLRRIEGSHAPTVDVTTPERQGRTTEDGATGGHRGREQEDGSATDASAGTTGVGPHGGEAGTSGRTDRTRGTDGDGSAGGGGFGPVTGTETRGPGHAVHDRYDRRGRDRVRVPRSPRSVVMIGATLVCYPLFVASSVLPAFPLWVNVTVGLCTLLLVAFLLSVPHVGVVVFGAWAVGTPFVLAVSGVGILSVMGVLVLAASWVPLGLSFLTMLALRF